MVSRTFRLLNGITVQAIGESTADFLQNIKGMYVESAPAQGGWVVHAKEQPDGWKTISGMTKAIQVQILEAGENVIVNCNFGKWSDKVGAGVAGAFIFAPLAVTAGIGAYQQRKLPEEIFAHIQQYIMFGGMTTTVTAGAIISSDKTICPQCKSTNQKGTNFCQNCGASLCRTCSNCGEQIGFDTKFCPNCGTSTTPQKKICKECGAELSDKTRFCDQCGKKVE